MSCAALPISTGTLVNPAASATPASGPAGMGPNVLFGPLSTSTTSRMVCIEAGKALMFFGHSFGGGTVTLSRVFFTPGKMPQSAPCECPTGCLTMDPGTVNQVAPLSLACNGFILSDCSDTLVVSLPGCYNLSLDLDVMLGDTYVEYREVDLATVPASLLVGNSLKSAPKLVAVVPSGAGYVAVYDDGSTAPLTL